MLSGDILPDESKSPQIMSRSSTLAWIFSNQCFKEMTLDKTKLFEDLVYCEI